MRNALLTLAMVIVVACGTSPGAAQDAGVQIVATNSIIGDLVAQIAGPEAQVSVLMPPGTDVHAFSPSASQVAELQSANLIVANGLGLEESMQEVLDEAAAQGARVLELAGLADPLETSIDHADEEEPHEADAGDEHPPGALDPHFWLDPVRVSVTIDAIAAALTEIAPGSWESRAESYSAQLDSLDARLRGDFDSLQKRTLVTSHENLAYLADRYDLEIAATILSSTSTLAEPSAEDLARVVETLSEFEVAAIFTDPTAARGLAEAAAGELDGAVEVVPLQTESLGEPGSATDSYIGMMDAIRQAITSALGA